MATKQIVLLVALILCTTVAGCKSDNAKYRDAQLKVGMSIYEIQEQFGEPDKYREWFNDTGTTLRYSDSRSQEYTHRVEELGYGPFGAHSQRIGHITKYRLSMTFVDGDLYEWEKSAPSDPK